MKPYKKTVATALVIDEVKRFLDNGQRVRLCVTGNSMRPYLGNGRDHVLLEKVKGETVKINDIVLAEIAPRTFAIHRVIRRDDKLLTLQGDGNIGITETCDEEKVLGRVTAFYRKGRTKPESLKGRRWRVYSWWWLRLTPLKRIILGVLRRLPFEV